MAASEHTDCRYGWIVVAAVTVTWILAVGVSASSGILFIEFLDYFGMAKSATATVNAVFMATEGAMGPVTGALVDRYGCRPLVISGGIIGTSAYVLGLFAPHVSYLYFTYSVLLGIANSCVVLSGTVIIQQYFDKRRALASAIAACGFNVSPMIYAPLSQYLIDTYGWRGTFLILGGLYSHIIPLGLLMRPIRISETPKVYNVPRESNEFEMRNVNESFQSEPDQCQNKDEAERQVNKSYSQQIKTFFVNFLDFSLLKDSFFYIYALHMVSGTLVRVVPDMFLPARAVGLGISKTAAALLISITGFTMTPSRIISGYIGDQKWMKRVYMFASCSCTTGIIVALVGMMKTYPEFLSFAVLFGIIAGGYAALYDAVAVDLLGLTRLPKALGLIYFLQAPSMMMLIPGLGGLVDLTDSYIWVFVITGIGHTICASVFYLVPVIRRHRANKNRKSVAIEESQNKTEHTV